MKYTEEQIRDEYISLDKSESSDLRRRQLIKMKHCPQDVLRLAFKEETTVFRYELMKDPRLPQDVIEEELHSIFLGTGRGKANLSILNNSSITTEAFRKANEAGLRAQGGKHGELTYRFFLFEVLTHKNCPRELMDYALSSGYLYF